jgi:hypothetical protein
MEEGKQLFRQYAVFNGDTFLEFLKKIHAKFPRCYLFMDKVSPNYKSKKVINYFEENKDTLYIYTFPLLHPPSLWLWKRGMEHQTRSTSPKVLYIICRFKE